MADSVLIALIIGTLLGSLSGLGIGGGSLLLLWLTAVVGTSPDTARAINLMFFIPCAFISTWMRKSQSIKTKPVVLTAAIAGAIGAALGNWLSFYVIDETLLRRALGILFLISGIRELCYRERKFR